VAKSVFAERFSGPPPKPKVKHWCGVKLTLDALPPADRDALELVLDLASGWQHAAIERELKAEGLNLQASTIRRHRNGMCACDDA
jgi:hypothetical protein